ncbi:MAG: uncharacterized protein KVP18_000665, partial [Porospora cf. gigantea A]
MALGDRSSEAPAVVGATPTPQSTPPKSINTGSDDHWAYFWRSVYRTSLPLPEARTLMPPTDRFEFCKEATLTPKEKSFVFACLLGVAPLLIPALAEHENIANLRLIPPGLPLLSQAQLRNMAAWHLVELLEMGLVQEVDSTPLEVFTPRDRMQYLQESRTFKSVPMLEEARWRSAKGVSTATLPRDLEIIIDMAMLLNLMEVASSAILLRESVIVLTIVFLAASPSERLVAYFQVQQFFQFARGVLLGKCPHSGEGSFDNLFKRRYDTFRHGWREYQLLSAGVVIDDPSEAYEGNLQSYFHPDRLKPAGLWPLFINPFRLFAGEWTSLQDMEPYNGVPLVEKLTALGGAYEPEISMSVNKGVRLLREHV